MKLAFVILLGSCLTVDARYYRNPFRRSVTVDTKEDATNTEAVNTPSNIDILLRNLIVGPPKGAEQIMLKVSSDKDRTSDEIASITKERDDQIQGGNQYNGNPKMERVINIVEDIESENDFNPQKSGENEDNDSNLNGDGRRSSESDGKQNERNTTSKPGAIDTKNTENSSSGTLITNAAIDIEKNNVYNSKKANANNSANDKKKPQQQQKNIDSEGNTFAINGETADKSRSDSESNESHKDDGNSASVERIVRNTRKSKRNYAEKLMSGKFVAKTRELLHTVPLMGHMLSVKVANQPAPGTN